MTVTIVDLPLIGGHCVLDLVNTVAPRFLPSENVLVENVLGENVLGENVLGEDFLVDATALVTWAHRAGVIDAAEARKTRDRWQVDGAAGVAALASIADIRESLFVVLLAVARTGATELPLVGPGVPAALARLHGHWTAAAQRSMFQFDASGGSIVTMTATSSTDSMITDRVLIAAVDLLRNQPAHQLRQCPPEQGGCGWLMLDTTRNGSRRWCRMADCGNHAKSRRLTDRRRRQRSGPTLVAAR
jgi:predicted RNA-binding Zn ribbon-like protein